MAVTIIDPDLIKARMGLPTNLSDIDNAIDSILPAVHLIFEGILETKFDPSTDAVDTFFVSDSKYPRSADGHYRLRLSQRFLVPAASVTMQIASKIAGPYTNVLADNFYVDKDKGIVYLDEVEVEALMLGYAYVKVTYSAGFSVTNKAPEWLVEAMLSYIPSLFNSQQATNRADEAGSVYEHNLKTASMILQSRMRGAAFHFRPVA